MRGRGGRVFALGTRCVWIHRRARTPSGRPMCRKDSSEKKRSFTLSSVRKLRISSPLNTGSASNHSAVAMTVNCASWSHGSM